MKILQTAILTMLFLCPLAAQALGPIPAWADQVPPASITFDPPPGSSVYWSQVPVRLRAPGIWGGGPVYAGPWEFLTQSACGDILVTNSRPCHHLGTVSTGFSDILFLTVAGPLLAHWPNSEATLLVTGRLSAGGRWAVGALPIDVDAAGVDPSQMVHSVPADLAETWYSVGVANGKVYVQSLPDNKIIHLRSSASGVLDVRDANVIASIPAEVRASIERFKSSPVALAEIEFGPGYRGKGYLESSGTKYGVRLSPKALTVVNSLRFRGGVVAGLGEVSLQGAPNRLVAIYTGPSATGPWSLAADKAFTQSSPLDHRLFSVEAPLVEGQFVAVKDFTSGGTVVVVRKVASVTPCILGVEGLVAGIARPGTELTLQGGHWGANPAVVLRRFDSSSGDGIDISLSSSLSGPGRLSVQIPATYPDSRVFLILTTAGGEEVIERFNVKS